MSRILQWYILQEMLKTFGLSTFALLLMFTSGMGLIRAVGIQDISPADMLQVFLFLVPLCAFFLLPIAALFSAAITYGRLAADNELDACKASGINVHLMLAPAGVLAVLVAACTFLFGNYIVPHLTGQVDKMIKPALPQIFARELANKGRLVIRNRALYADGIDTVSEQRPGPDGEMTTHHYVVLNRAAFIESDDAGPIRFGTAATATIEFDIVGNMPSIDVGLHNLRIFDWRRKQYYEVGYEPIRPVDIPFMIKQKPKWWNLNELLHYRNHPTEAPNIRTQVEALRLHIAANIFYRTVVEALSDPHSSLTLQGPTSSYHLQAQQVSVDQQDGAPILIKPTVLATEPDRTRRLTAEQAVVRADLIIDKPVVRVTLRGNVRIEDSLAPSRIIPKPSQDLRLLPLPQEAIQAATAYSSAQIVNLDQPLPLTGAPALGREQLVNTIALLQRKINGVIHMRLAYSVFPLVLVVLGAALGVIVRGGQVLTAFGVSFIPALFVIVTIIMGRQLAEQPDKALIGLVIIWTGIAVAAAMNPVIIGRYMKR